VLISKEKSPLILKENSGDFLFENGLPVIGLPTMVVAVPPLMVFIPTVLAFGFEIAATVIGFVAALTVVADSVVEIGFGFLYCVLASRSIVGMRHRYSCEPGKRGHHHYCNCCVSNSSNQGFLLSIAAGICRSFRPNISRILEVYSPAMRSGTCCRSVGFGFSVTKVHGAFRFNLSAGLTAFWRKREQLKNLYASLLCPDIRRIARCHPRTRARLSRIA
jgi:hypothetical protein